MHPIAHTTSMGPTHSPFPVPTKIHFVRHQAATHQLCTNHLDNYSTLFVLNRYPQTFTLTPNLMQAPQQISATVTTTQGNVSVQDATSNMPVSSVITQATLASNVPQQQPPLFARNGTNQTKHSVTNAFDRQVNVHIQDHRFDRDVDDVNNIDCNPGEHNATDRNIAYNNTDRNIVNNNVHSHKNMDIDIVDNNAHCHHPLPDKAVSPINNENFQNCLTQHPDQELVNYLVNGLQNGFNIGFTAPHTVTRPKNLLSATEHQTDVTTALLKEVTRGHIAGLFESPPWPDLHHWDRARKKTVLAG